MIFKSFKWHRIISKIVLFTQVYAEIHILKYTQILTAEIQIKTHKKENDLVSFLRFEIVCGY